MLGFREVNRPPSFAIGAANVDSKSMELREKKFPINLQKTWSDYFSVYDTERFRKMWKLAEPELYQEYSKLMLTNAIANFLFKGLDDAIFGPGYHFEGDKNAIAKAKLMWRQHKIEPKLERAVGHAIIYGNGYLHRTGSGDNLEIQDLHGATVFFYQDGKMYQDAYKTPAQRQKTNLNADDVVHFKLLDLGSSYYGISLFRPNLPLIWGLFDAAGDILQAIKRAAYAPVVAYLDLESVPNDTEKENTIREFSDMLHSIVSASTNYVLDNRHRVEMLSAGGGRGSGLNLPVIDLISPLMSIIMLNFNIATSVYGAEGGVEPEVQDLFVSRGLKRLKNKIKYLIDTELLPMLLGDDADVEFVWNLSDSEYRFRARLLLEMYSGGAISREFFQDELDIEDEGQNFIPVPGRIGGGLPGE
jgi:hypothetical protein